MILTKESAFWRFLSSDDATRPTTWLRRLLARDELLVAPGVFDGLSARLAERAGAGAVYASGGAIARAAGYPDLGLLGVGEVLARLTQIAEAVDVPVIADADTGYGNALNVRRTVRAFERAGVAALHLAVHARYLVRRYWKTFVTVSFPRLRPAAFAVPPEHPVSDADLARLVCAFRLLLPDVGLVLSTRESPAFPAPPGCWSPARGRTPSRSSIPVRDSASGASACPSGPTTWP